MWLGFTVCRGECMLRADRALNLRGVSSALPAADEAEQPVPTTVRAFPTWETHLSMALNLSQYP